MEDIVSPLATNRAASSTARTGGAKGMETCLVDEQQIEFVFHKQSSQINNKSKGCQERMADLSDEQADTICLRPAKAKAGKAGVVGTCTSSFKMELQNHYI